MTTLTESRLCILVAYTDNNLKIIIMMTEMFL